MISYIKRLFTKDSNTKENTNLVVIRLDYEVYKKLERTLDNSQISNTTTDLQAGFKLGVQHVLFKLREGYVIENRNDR